MSVLLIIGLKNAILVVPLALLALGIGRWSRRPALTHLLWTLVLVKMLTPPLIHIPIGWQVNVESWVRNEQPAPSVNATPAAPSRSRSLPSTARKSAAKYSAGRSAARGTVNAAGSSATASTGFSNITDFLSWNRLWQSKFEILAAIWLAGSLFILFKLGLKSFQFYRFLNLVEKRDESLGPRAAELAVQARIGIAPRVIVVDSVVSPMLWGMGRRACLVFPSRLVSRLSAAELDALLLHELAHFARGDHWVRVLELASSVVYWWHPVIWWARHELEIAEEQCCDAWVVERQSGEPLSYAKALLATIDFLHEPAAFRPPVACGLGEVPFLRTRLTQIMRGQVAARLPNTLQCLVIVAGVLSAPLEPALWASGSNGPAGSVKPWKQFLSTPRGPTPPLVATSTSTTTQAVSSRVDPESSPAKQASTSSNSSQQLPNRLRGSSLPRAPKSHFASAISPDGKYRMEARVGQQTTLITPSASPLILTSARITCMAFAPNSQTFATGHDDTSVRLWDSNGGLKHPFFRGCDSPIKSVQISPDGRLLAAGCQSGRVIVWDIESMDEVRRIDEQGSEVSCVRWSEHGNQLAVSLGAWSNQEELRLVVWDPVAGRELLNQGLEQPVGALDWLPGEGKLVLAGWDGYSRIMNVTTGLIDSEIQIEKDRVSAAAWSPNCLLLERGANELSAMRK